ncbi:MAG TPA: hypothetical protein VF460_00260 [Burkholderiales bacterium]
MATGLPFSIEVVFLVLVLPLAFAYLISIAGLAVMCLRTALRKLVFRFHTPRSRP